MKLCHMLCATLLALPLISAAQEQKTYSSDKPKIYAQKLLDETMARHKEVVIMAFHVTPPNQTDNIIIASNIGRYGKKADEDDLRVVDKGESNLEVNKAGNHFEDECPLLDKAGNRIGAVGIVFNYKAGDDKAKLAKAAESIRDEMAQKITSKDTLFEPLK
jgi:hypothetical protein